MDEIVAGLGSRLVEGSTSDALTLIGSIILAIFKMLLVGAQCRRQCCSHLCACSIQAEHAAQLLRHLVEEGLRLPSTASLALLGCCSLFLLNIDACVRFGLSSFQPRAAQGDLLPLVHQVDYLAVPGRIVVHCFHSAPIAAVPGIPTGLRPVLLGVGLRCIRLDLVRIVHRSVKLA